MGSRRRIATMSLMVLAALGLGGVMPSSAQVPPILIEPVTPRSTFPDDVRMQFRVKLEGHATTVVNVPDPSRTIVARITVQPEAVFPWHTHSGPVVVNVAQGELVYVAASDCEPRSYAAGTAFVDPGRGHVHTAYNRTETPTVFYATFFDVSAVGPLTITDGISAPPGCTVSP